MKVDRVGDGIYRVTHAGRSELVFVAGTADDRWAFVNGSTFRSRGDQAAARRSGRSDVAQSLTAPMPATVLKVLVQPGATVRKGDTVLILEAMKMELPIRAPADATISAVCCREGDLVPADAMLVELK
jgi:3-methylcrotonyl-CoA carboxylase alpha subunit